jgi:hypothetical protein
MEKLTNVIDKSPEEMVAMWKSHRQTMEEIHEQYEEYKKFKNSVPLLDNIVLTPNITTYYGKVLMGKQFLQLYRYHDGIRLNSKMKTLNKIRTNQYVQRSNGLAVQNIRSLMLENFKENDKFITLTFKNTDKFNLLSIDACATRKENFINKLKKLYPNVKYLLVPELQARGAIHYHMVTDARLSFKQLNHLWRYGFTYNTNIQNVLKASSYLTKYLSKNFGMEQFLGRRRYYCSTNLSRPTVVTGDLASKIISVVDSYDVAPVSSRSYNTEFHGKVTYELYRVSDFARDKL